jgi:hypothetical protein
VSDDVLSISSEMREYLTTQIEPDEKVLWADTTNVSGRMRRLMPIAGLSLAMIPLCSFVFWSNPSRALLVALSVLVWVGIPILIVWGQSDHLRRTLYAITDRRALILSVGKPQRTESYPPESIRFVQPVARPSGRGDLYFTLLEGTGTSRQSFKHGFLDIPQVEQVADLMRRTLVGESPQA